MTIFYFQQWLTKLRLLLAPSHVKSKNDNINQTFKIPENFTYSVNVVGKCVVQALEDGENGSTWQCENRRIEKLNISEYPKF